MRLRDATAAVLVGLLLAGCTPPDDPQVPAVTEDAVRLSRDALGEPMLALAESVIAVSDGLDQARFDVARGDDMQAAVKALTQRRDAAAQAQRDAAAALEGVPIKDARDIVAEAAARTSAVLPAVDEELAFLRRVAALDRALFDAAATWDEPGSQSEIRERLLALSSRIADLRPTARKLRPVPKACTAMKSNRLDWIATLRTRTLALQEQANSFGGSTYDELRKSYRALPFAEEPRTADRADRACRQKNSEVPAVADDVRAAVDKLREALR